MRHLHQILLLSPQLKVSAASPEAEADHQINHQAGLIAGTVMLHSNLAVSLKVDQIADTVDQEVGQVAGTLGAEVGQIADTVSPGVGQVAGAAGLEVSKEVDQAVGPEVMDLDNRVDLEAGVVTDLALEVEAAIDRQGGIGLVVLENQPVAADLEVGVVRVLESVGAEAVIDTQRAGLAPEV